MSLPIIRKGLEGTLTRYEIVYESERVIGQKNGIPIVIFFAKSPYILKKEISYIWLGPDEVEALIQEYVRDYTSFLTTGQPPYMEAPSIGKLVRINEKDLYECSTTVVSFSNNFAGVLPVPTQPVTYESGNCSPNGYYHGLKGGPIGKAMFPYGFFTSTITKKYISNSPLAKIGEFTNGGIVTNVDKSNPRYNGDDTQLIYDFTETITNLNGTSYS